MRQTPRWNNDVFRLVLSFVLAGIGSSAALAQCPSADWRLGWGFAGADDTVYASTTWDPDGDGPTAPQLVIGGRFTHVGVSANHIAIWVGSYSQHWQALGEGRDSTVLALTTWDPDDDGPAPVLLVATEEYINAMGTRVDRVSTWDGKEWHYLGTDFNSAIFALTSWDPDGAGPARSYLIAGGVTHVDGIESARVMSWDGSGWHSLGIEMPEVPSIIKAITTWDPDGDGPANPQLVVGGGFSMAGDSPANNIARWDGSAWQALGIGVNGGVYALTTWDADGDGPMTPMIVAGGSFLNAGGVTANRVAAWTNSGGGTWRSFDTGTSGTVYSLTVWDHDGNGPEQPTIVAGGFFETASGVSVNHVTRWDGVHWQSFGTDTVPPAPAPAPLYTLSTWNHPDSNSGNPAWLVAGGDIHDAEGNLKRILYWDATDEPGWKPLSSERPIGAVQSSFLWDQDGDGIGPKQLVVGGTFRSSASDPDHPTGIARWDGSDWQRFASGALGTKAMISWDPDGEGPAAPQLIAGGLFDTAGGVQVNYIAGWDGLAWHSIGGGMNHFGYVYSLATWDPDGDGPLNAQLVAGGTFSRSGGFVASGIARWDGTQWLAFGTNPVTRALAIINWDSDGDGPAPSQLVAGGEGNSGTFNRIARWDGASWQPFGSGLSGGPSPRLLSLALWDPDDDGPLPHQLVAGGMFQSAGGVVANNIARWDPAGNGQWRPFGSGVNGAIYTLCVWDPDGTGPVSPQLVAAGDFTMAGGIAAAGIARWDGLTWQSLTSGFDARVYTLLTMDPESSTVDGPSLVAGGSFSYAGSIHSTGITRLIATDSASIFFDQPRNERLCHSEPISLRAAAVGRSPIVYSWEWRELDQLGSDFRPVVSGLNTPAPGLPSRFTAVGPTDEFRLHLDVLSPGPQVEFRAVSTSDCGIVNSEIATLTICLADFSCDGFVNSQDFFDFLAAFFSLEPTADLNRDTFINSQDFFDFLAGFFTGC